MQPRSDTEAGVSTGQTAAPGQSGAVVRLYDESAYKFGGPDVPRLVAQGEWLQAHPAPGIVRVSQVGLEGYWMERLSPLPVSMLDLRRTAIGIIDVLRRDIWLHPPETTLDWDGHVHYVLQRAAEHAPAYAPRLNTAQRRVDPESLVRCLTHGDPTFANVLLRDGDPVLVDPIPADWRVPPLQAVDLGKIVQSLLGYEVLRFDWPLPRYRHRRQVEMFLTASAGIAAAEASAAVYFAAAHVVRLLPYTPSAKRPAMLKLLDALV